jgi:hypothetical protein
VVNSSPSESRTVATGTGEATVYQLTGDLDSAEISLNGTPLMADEDGTLPDLTGEAVDGTIEVPPASVAFVVEPTDVAACS